MGLSRAFIESPGLPLVYVAYNGLAAGVDMNVLDPHCLLTATSKLGQSFYLCGICSQKLHRQATARIRLDGSLRGPRAFSKEWSDVAASIGIQATFHSLRHTHASHLIDAGIDVVKISRRLGHASPAITLRVYAHLFRARDDKSTAAINAAVAALLD